MPAVPELLLHLPPLPSFDLREKWSCTAPPPPAAWRWSVLVSVGCPLIARDRLSSALELVRPVCRQLGVGGGLGSPAENVVCNDATFAFITFFS